LSLGVARAVISSGKTQEEAERDVANSSDSIRVLRSKRLDLSDLGPAWADATLWIVGVEWVDRDKPDPLPQQEDPEGETEAQFRADHARGFGTGQSPR
jgi:hypothetical protein